MRERNCILTSNGSMGTLNRTRWLCETRSLMPALPDRRRRTNRCSCHDAYDGSSSSAPPSPSPQVPWDCFHSCSFGKMMGMDDRLTCPRVESSLISEHHSPAFELAPYSDYGDVQYLLFSVTGISSSAAWSIPLFTHVLYDKSSTPLI
jgi:hypothetical protein